MRFHAKSSMTTKCPIIKISQTNIIKVKLHYFIFIFAINSKKIKISLTCRSIQPAHSPPPQPDPAPANQIGKKNGDPNYYNSKKKSFGKSVIDK